MSSAETPVLLNDSGSFTIGPTAFDPSSVRCHLAILREEDGSFSSIVLNLPGAGSCGDSEEEAVANAREAVVGLIETYKEDGDPIPWKDTTQYSVPEGAVQKWILVNA